VVVGFQRFGRTYCNTIFRVEMVPQYYTAQQHRKPRILFTSTAVKTSTVILLA